MEAWKRKSEISAGVKLKHWHVDKEIEGEANQP